MQEIGRSIIRLESINSTNNYTANRAREGELRHGAVILAVEQTAGKGQTGAHWQSNAGENLTFSVFLDNVNLSVARQFLLTKIVSLSLVDLLKDYGVQARIKWPNDIYVGNKKIAGVLIENIIQGKTIVRSICGIGLNVNQLDFGDLNATSISLEMKKQFVLDELLFSFIAKFNTQLERMESYVIHEEYQKLLFWMGEAHRFEDFNGQFLGEILGTSERGELRVKRLDEQEHEVKEYNLKEIRFIR